MERQHTKGQSAMEFLMTYGWAIILLFGVVGALAYYNVFSPSRYFPDECILFDKVKCTEFKVSRAQIDIVARNEFGQLLDPFNITIISDLGCAGNTINAVNGLADGESEKISFACAPILTGDSYEAILNITYTGGSGVQHVAYGTLKSKIE